MIAIMYALSTCGYHIKLYPLSKSYYFSLLTLCLIIKLKVHMMFVLVIVLIDFQSAYSVTVMFRHLGQVVGSSVHRSIVRPSLTLMENTD